MSASREKKTHQREAEQGINPREQKRQQEAKEAHRSKILYSVVGAVCVVLAVAVFIWNSGVLPRTMTAVTINGEKYTAVDVQYYFNMTRNSVANQYKAYLGMVPFNTGASTKDQEYNSETGETWYDYLMEQAMNTMTANAALADKAEAEGYTMTQKTKDSMDSTLKNLETAWVGTPYSSRDAYLRAIYGSYISYDRYVELLTRDLLASDYAKSIYDGLTYTDEDYEAYYKENSADLDNYTLTQFVFQAKVQTTDEEGKTIEMSDEEKAEKLSAAQAEVKAVAEKLKAELEGGKDPAVLAEEYADQLSSSSISKVTVGSSLDSNYSQWAKDNARKAGEITLEESASSDTSTYYYVVRFEGRQRDDTNTADVRHILIRAEKSEGAEKPTEEQYAAAEQKAQELLEKWKAGEATEESFTQLAKENSQDPGVKENDGLYANISGISGYVAPFRDWALGDHQVGDTGIVRSDDSQGYHIMYYVGSGDPVWKLTADSVLRSDDYAEKEEELSSGYEDAAGFGMNLVKG